MGRPKSSFEELQQALSVFGLELVDVSDRWPYSERAGKSYGVFDKGRQLCTYSSPAQIKKWVRSKLIEDYEAITSGKD